MSEARAVLRWIAAPVLALVLYWPGLTAWFQSDDFAWLSLRDLWLQGEPLGWILFQPLAQGTIRTLSERVYFTAFYELFGLNAFPYHLAAFLTFALSLPLLQLATEKLTGSRHAGFWAAIVWVANGALAIPLTWAAMYNELLLAFLMLSAVLLLLRYIETGKTRFFAGQAAVFVLGFGAQELNVVYPGIALAIVLARAPREWRKVAWLFVVSAIYMGAHIWVSPLPASGPYKLYWDWSMARTLLTYASWSLGPVWMSLVGVHSVVARGAMAAVLAIGLLGFLVWKIREGRWVVLVFPAWFAIVLAPLVPLKDHVSYEYLTVPVIGLAMLAGWGIASGRRVAGAPLAVVYLGASIPVTHALAQRYHDQSIRLRNTFESVLDLHREHPEDFVILRNVDSELFENMIYHHAFRLAGVQIYIAAEEEAHFDLRGREDAIREFFIDPRIEKKALDQKRGVVFDAATDTFNFDAGDAARMANSLSSRIEVGSEIFADQMGPTWYPSEGLYRWMPKWSSVVLAAGGSQLVIRGYCPAATVKDGPLTVEVTVNGEKLAPAQVSSPEQFFELNFELPEMKPARQLAVRVDLDRTFRAPGDLRDLGLAITSIEVRERHL